ncbi:MAG: hypothetical protein Q4G69_07295 [Planctomycetia bacterium]|nr:hypothetical protein [Planctomycetia bacterium]
MKMPLKSLSVCLILLLGSAILFTSGCQKGPKPPEGLPRLYPAVLILKQEGKPLANASITLMDAEEEGPNARWGISAASDENGEAVLKVNGLFKGCPAGRFKVVIIKNETEKGTKMPPAPDPVANPIEYEKWRIESEKPRPVPKTFCLVDQKYSDFKTTPVEVEIKEGSNRIDVDAGKSVRNVEKIQIL